MTTTMTVGTTPGPWELQVANPGKVKARIWSDNTEFPWIAEVRSSLADAQLIAAAPDLLAALIRLVAACEREAWDEPDDDLTVARAAISKATGGEA